MKKTIARKPNLYTSKIQSCVKTINQHNNSRFIQKPEDIAAFFVKKRWDITPFLDDISKVIQEILSDYENEEGGVDTLYLTERKKLMQSLGLQYSWMSRKKSNSRKIEERIAFLQRYKGQAKKGFDFISIDKEKNKIEFLGYSYARLKITNTHIEQRFPKLKNSSVSRYEKHKFQSYLNIISQHKNGGWIQKPKQIANIFVTNKWDINLFLNGISEIMTEVLRCFDSEPGYFEKLSLSERKMIMQRLGLKYRRMSNKKSNSRAIEKKSAILKGSEGQEEIKYDCISIGKDKKTVKFLGYPYQEISVSDKCRHEGFFNPESSAASWIPLIRCVYPTLFGSKIYLRPKSEKKDKKKSTLFFGSRITNIHDDSVFDRNTEPYIAKFINLLTGLCSGGLDTRCSRNILRAFISHKIESKDINPLYQSANNILDQYKDIFDLNLDVYLLKGGRKRFEGKFLENRKTITNSAEGYCAELTNELEKKDVKEKKDIYVFFNCKDHAVTLKLSYDNNNGQLVVSVYNSGGGLEHHDFKNFGNRKHENLKQKVKTVKQFFKNIEDRQDLKDTLQGLHDCREKEIVELYNYLNITFRCDPAHQSVIYQSPQKGENCTFENILAMLNNTLQLQEYIQFRIDLAQCLINEMRVESITYTHTKVRNYMTALAPQTGLDEKETYDLDEILNRLKAQIANRKLKLEKIQEWSAVIKNDPPDTDKILGLFENCNSRDRYQCMRLAIEIDDPERRESVLGLLKSNLTEEDRKVYYVTNPRKFLEDKQKVRFGYYLMEID